MANVFGPHTGDVTPPLRNPYDKQHQQLHTANFGELKPCFCYECIPGETVKIDVLSAVRSVPIVFPINTRIKMYVHFFYGRNRTLHKEWEDFIFKTKEVTPPLLKLNNARAKKMISTGSLGDCLGVPSTYGTDFTYSFTLSDQISLFPRVYVQRESLTYVPRPSEFRSSLRVVTGGRLPDPFSDTKTYGLFVGWYTRQIPFLLSTSSKIIVPQTGYSDNTSFQTLSVFIIHRPVGSTDNFYIDLGQELALKVVNSTDISATMTNSFTDAFVARFNQLVSDLDNPQDVRLLFTFNEYEHDTGFLVNSGAMPYSTLGTSFTSFLSWSLSSITNVGFSDVVDATDDRVISVNKFIGDSPDIPLSALPFRLYEMICNYFYRNDQNNPYVLNGEVQYNQFIPSYDSGWDENEYVIHHRNWEMDAYTSAVPSPQFGAAPLVGITYNGRNGLATFTFEGVPEGGSDPKQYEVQVAVNEETSQIDGIVNYDKDTPSGSLRNVIDLATYGISINDLRNVNSFQRFKENMLRRGLRYRNQMLSHFGINVDYPDIDVPQFIGGYSADLTVQEVTNLAETQQAALGDVSGKINAVTRSEHSISCYCPEHGFIMGIFSIVPIPTYSQVLPKMFTRYNALDYFNSEFSKIGYVPIFHREFLPLQTDDPDKVFGYQRAWYEYMSAVDQVHGDFRTTYRDFVLYRQFKDVPTLNEDFLTVHKEALNNIFVTDKVEDKYGSSDKFMVQFYYDYKSVNPIPKHGIASLE